jgi:hypothetical protein
VNPAACQLDVTGRSAANCLPHVALLIAVPMRFGRASRIVACRKRFSMEIKVIMLASLFSMIAALYHLSNWRVAKTDE